MAKRCQLMLKEIYERAESEGDKALVVEQDLVEEEEGEKF